MTSKAQTDTQECIECGDEITPEDDAVFGAGGINDDGAEKLFDGETVPVSELFGFDDGPYCSLGCPLEGDDGE